MDNCRTCCTIATIVATIVATLAAPLAASDRIVLRNLDILRDCTITSFDDDGVVLAAARPDGSNLVRWDEIERGKLAAERQAEFDALLAELGTPLYRIRQRLHFGDYGGLLEPAEGMYSRYAARQGETAYMVCQATMWARLAAGQRERAVEPYLRCYEQLRSRAAKISNIPGPRRLQLDAKSGLSIELTPVWFDAAAAREALPAVKEAWQAMAQPPPAGAAIYYATLAYTAEQTGEAEAALATLMGDSTLVGEWRSIIGAQAEVLANTPGPAVAVLAKRRDSLSPAARPAGLYWLGLAGLQSGESEQRQAGLLDLLTIAAAYGRQEPELAAAGIYQALLALDKLKEEAASAALRRELLQNYAVTAHAAKVRGASGPR